MPGHSWLMTLVKDMKSVEVKVSSVVFTVAVALPLSSR